jgi:hypothetical protein
VSFEQRGNVGEVWGACCPNCGTPTGGVDRAAHARLVDAAEQRGMNASGAVVDALSLKVDFQAAELATLRLALRAWYIGRWWERLLARLTLRRMKP